MTTAAEWPIREGGALEAPRAEKLWRYRFASLVIDVLYVLALPLLAVVWLILSRCFTNPKYRGGFGEKLGDAPKREGDSPSFWIHAVSVGEVQAAIPLLEALEHHFPSWEVSLSVTTSTGYEVAKKRLSEKVIFYSPFDLSICVRRALRRRRPTAILLMELELWPNFVLQPKIRGVPVFVVNGRLSERSGQRYGYGGGATAALFRWVDGYGVQNEDYARRFQAVGVDESRLAVLGNLKYDRRPGATADEGKSLRKDLGWDEATILVAGCTHPGEESGVSSIYSELRTSHADLRLILAPRHVERLASEKEQSWSDALTFVRWSELRQQESRRVADGAVLVVDVVGELELFYAAADAVFVGGSLVERGGHNMLEPTRLAKATVFGPHVANFKEEAAILLSHEAAVQVEGREELQVLLAKWLDEPDTRRNLGSAAAEVVAGLEGAAKRHAEWLEGRLRLFFARSELIEYSFLSRQ